MTEKLTMGVEPVSKAELADRMETEFVGRTLHCLDVTTSTNEDAKRLAAEGAPDGTLVVAETQTQGRGRRGRGWESPAGKSVYFSLLMRPDIPPDRASMLTLVMALSVAEAIEGVCGGRQSAAACSDGSAAVLKNVPEEPGQAAAFIKWPNDIVMDGRKVCGILTELLMEEGRIQGVIIGVGINVNQSRDLDFPEQVREFAGSVRMACGRETDRAKLIADVMLAFEKNYKIFLQTCDLAGLKNAYESRLANINRQVRVLDPKGEFTGMARGINARGELLVEKDDGTTVNVYAGEVSVRGLYGYV